jgi:hypothetical protein
MNKMNIRKIIKEEIDDFDWVRNVDPLSFDALTGKALEFNPAVTDEDYAEKILNKLKSMGFTCLLSPQVVTDNINRGGLLGLYLDGSYVVWTAEHGWTQETYQEHISNYAGEPVEVLDGNLLFGWLKK